MLCYVAKLECSFIVRQYFKSISTKYMPKITNNCKSKLDIKMLIHAFIINLVLILIVFFV